MQCLATLCVVKDGDDGKVIAISPEGNKWFVNRADLTEEYQELCKQTEAEGKVLVLGMLFGPDGKNPQADPTPDLGVSGTTTPETSKPSAG